MLKKVLTIAMIGTSLVSVAKVNMFFRDGVLANPDFGGHFMSWHTEGTDEVLYKSISAETTVQDLLDYMHNYAEKQDEQLSPTSPWADQVTENGWWPGNEADPTSGPRYFRTCKPTITGFQAKEDRPGVPVPVSGGPSSWAAAGATTDCKVLAFDYISNMSHSSNGAIMYQETGGLDMHNLSYEVADDWKSIYAIVNLPEAWINDEKGGYLWITHNGWQNIGEEIVIRVKNLRLLTLAEAEAECAGAKGDVGLTLIPGNACFLTEKDDEGEDIYITNDGDPNGYNPVLFGSSMVANVPVENTILAFDYKASVDVRSITYYIDKGSKGAPAVAGVDENGLKGCGEEEVFDPETPYTAYQFDLAEAFATHEFARTFGSNDRIWVGMKDSDPETYIYFKNIRLTDGKGGNTSAIDEVAADNAVKATGLVGAIAVEANGAFTVYNLAGVAVAAGEGNATVAVEAGLYVVVADKAAQKVVVK